MLESQDYSAMLVCLLPKICHTPAAMTKVSGITHELPLHAALSVYLSAGHILQQDFHGKRLDEVLKSNSMAVTNLWPYLRSRRTEVDERRKLYQQSFLPRALKGRAPPISRRLWGSPGAEKQLTIAIRSEAQPDNFCYANEGSSPRFLMTRFWFAVSLGGQSSENWLLGTIVDTQETVPGEIWTVNIHTAADPPSSSTPKVETLYVLEATCEVIGHPPQPSQPQAAQSPSTILRADWSAYIATFAQTRQATKGSSGPSLLSHLKWANYEEYDQGISKHWLRRISSEGDAGVAKRTVAFRYVLACVVANRSGRLLFVLHWSLKASCIAA